MYLTDEQANDYNLVRRVAEQVVHAPVYSVKRLESGRAAYTYEIDNHLIFKLPNNRTSVSAWQTRSQMAHVLQDSLSYRIPQPYVQPVFLSANTKDELAAFYYEKIPGKTLPFAQKFSKTSPRFRTHFFEQVADFAVQLHAIPLDKLSVRPPSINSVLTKIFLTKSKTPFIEKLFTSASHWPLIGCRPISDDVLCHRDLHPGNICLDNRGNVTGILDFDLMCTGERFVEFYPHLYKDPKDQKFFQEIYTEQSGVSLSQKDINRLRSLRFLNALHFFSE